MGLIYAAVKGIGKLIKFVFKVIALGIKCIVTTIHDVVKLYKYRKRMEAKAEINRKVHIDSSKEIF